MNIIDIISKERGPLITRIIGDLGPYRSSWLVRDLILNDDHQTLEYVLQSGVFPLDTILEGGRGLTMLHLAIKHGADRCLSVLMRYGASPKIKDDLDQDGFTSADVYDNTQALLTFSRFQ